MEDLWFEEELVPNESTIEEVVKSSPSKDSEINQQVRSEMRGILRVNRPRGRQLNQQEKDSLLMSGKKADFYLVRLGFQFDITPKAREHGYCFVEGRCSARLDPAQSGQPQPTVYEVIPRDHYKGKPCMMGVKISPTIQLGMIQAEIGEVSQEISVGYVETEIVGWSGDNECEPYWELRPQSHNLKGERHLWLIVEAPLGCSGVLLGAKAEGILRSRLFGLFHVGPRISHWNKRRKILI
ncbi:MAG: hypothetical protein D6756_03795 [Cyanobacteria bacterium J083]|nr:MAG: hypothetical protein D6756_03795 [Cyanobacteria bacterium J083]